jgi:hypothetical protein
LSFQIGSQRSEQAYQTKRQEVKELFANARNDKAKGKQTKEGTPLLLSFH